MKEVTNISVIIPIHKLDDNTKPLFENAVKSVRIQFITPDELLIVVPSGTETEKYLKSFDFSGITLGSTAITPGLALAPVNVIP